MAMRPTSMIEHCPLRGHLGGLPRGALCQAPVLQEPIHGDIRKVPHLAAFVVHAANIASRHPSIFALSHTLIRLRTCRPTIHRAFPTHCQVGLGVECLNPWVWTSKVPASSSDGVRPTRGANRAQR